MDAVGTGTNHCPQGVGIVTANTGWWSSATSINVSASNTDVMNQLCRVCGEPAAGFHFGAFTCEGCKSFFGRTYNNLGSISECKNGGVCVINKKNRTACKACRLRKCLIVGMSKSGSRYGRRSNWFKIHCLLQEQSHQVQTRLKDSKSLYESFSSLDVANNNSNSNNVDNNMTSGSNVVVANSVQDRLLVKKDETEKSVDLEALRSMEVARGQEMLRPPEIPRPHHLLRPESRFPMWRGPFFHPALTQMQLLNANPFFPFQQRFIVPYMNQVNTTQLPMFGSSSDSASSRSTPSPKQDKDAVAQAAQQQHTLEKSSETEVMSDQSIAFLRSLGPEQEEPIDLSTKHAEEFSECQSEKQKELLNENSDASDILPGAPPLDLTRKT